MVSKNASNDTSHVIFSLDLEKTWGMTPALDSTRMQNAALHFFCFFFQNIFCSNVMLITK